MKIAQSYEAKIHPLFFALGLELIFDDGASLFFYGMTFWDSGTIITRLVQFLGWVRNGHWPE